MKIDFSTLPNKAPEYDLIDLLEAGCHFGHQKAKRHPRMNEYIYAEKDGIHIFDLAITAKQLQNAYNFVYDQASKGKTMTMVGTKKQARELIEEAGTTAGVQYITSRWLGGFLTNWTQVKRSLRKMLDIESGLKSGKFDGYTKFEKVQLEKERVKLARFFIGLRDLKKSPDFLFVVDIHREKNAIAEAKNMGVPVVAIVDSNSNPDGIDIVIPANDDAVRSLSFLITEITKAYQEGKKDAGKSVKTPTKTAPVSEAVKKEAKAALVAKPVEKVAEVKAPVPAQKAPVKEETKVAAKTEKKAPVKTEAKKEVATTKETKKTK
jgi:small subunit ribosomal protein S2